MIPSSPIWSTLTCYCRYGKHAVPFHALSARSKIIWMLLPSAIFRRLVSCLGNKMANDTAQQVNAQFCSSLASELDDFHRRIQFDKQQLEQVYLLLLALTDARLRLPQMEPAPPEWGVTVDRAIHSCVDWSLQSPLDFSPQADTQFVGDRVFGADFALKGCLILHGQPILTKGPQKDGSTSSTCHCDDLPMVEGTLS